LEQYGHQTPFEWTFPTAEWLRQARELSGRRPTELPALETLHIVHVLEQTVRGYICGTNTNRWTNHLLNYNNIRNQVDVTNFFFRLEFQRRGTPHVHLLVWLKNVSAIQYNYLRADIPEENREIAYQVADLQPL